MKGKWLWEQGQEQELERGACSEIHKGFHSQYRLTRLTPEWSVALSFTHSDCWHGHFSLNYRARKLCQIWQIVSISPHLEDIATCIICISQRHRLFKNGLSLHADLTLSTQDPFSTPTTHPCCSCRHSTVIHLTLQTQASCRLTDGRCTWRNTPLLLTSRFWNSRSLTARHLARATNQQQMVNPARGDTQEICQVSVQ